MVSNSVKDIMEKFYEEDVYTAGIADQCIGQGMRFAGSAFSSMPDENAITKLKKYTAITGEWPARQEYKGIFGCDFPVDAVCRIFSLEINACKQGAAHERLVFKKVTEGNLKNDFLVFEHTGNDFIVAEGAFVGRIATLGHGSESIRQGLELGRKTLELTIA